jgi:hypothetical protein
MFIAVNSTYSPKFRGELPIATKGVTGVADVTRTESSPSMVTSTKMPTAAAMAAAAGVVMAQGDKAVVDEYIQAENLALCEAKQVPLAPTVESIQSTIEEPVVFEGQTILGANVDIVNVDFKPLIAELIEQNADEEPMRISCNGVEYDISYRSKEYSGPNDKDEKIMVTPIKDGEPTNEVYTVFLVNGKIRNFSKKTTIDVIKMAHPYRPNEENLIDNEIYKKEKVNFYRGKNHMSEISYASKFGSYTSTYYLKEKSDKILSIQKGLNYYTEEDWYQEAYNGPVNDTLIEKIKKDSTFDNIW